MGDLSMAPFHMTRACLAALDEGRVPGWNGPMRSCPDDPTPIYDEVKADQLSAVIVPLSVMRTKIPQVIPRARRTDPGTSHEAARSVTKISDTHGRILVILNNHPGGATDEELLREYNMHRTDIGAPHVDGWPPLSPSGLRSRRHELVQMGKIVDSGERGKTAAGRSCIVWRLA